MKKSYINYWFLSSEKLIVTIIICIIVKMLRGPKAGLKNSNFITLAQCGPKK